MCIKDLWAIPTPPTIGNFDLEGLPMLCLKVDSRLDKGRFFVFGCVFSGKVFNRFEGESQGSELCSW